MALANHSVSDGRRIYGTETECGLYWHEIVPDGMVFDQNFLDEMLCCDKFQDSGAHVYFMLNGGGFRKDNPKEQSYTPEYASPECRSAKDLVRWEKAGEVILNRLYKLEGENLGKILLVKHCRDNYGQPGKMFRDSTLGHHENYSFNSTMRPVLFDGHSFIFHFFSSFLVARLLFSGSGWLDLSGITPNFQISARSDFLKCLVGASTTSDRSLLCSKDERLSHEGLSRLHLILGDHHMSEISLFLEVGTTAIMLKILESCFDNSWSIDNERSKFLRSPLEAIRIFNGDLTFTKTSLLIEPGQSIGILGINDYFCGVAEDFIRVNGSTSEEAQVVSLWRHVIDTLNRGVEGIYLLKDSLDWATKLWIMESHLRNKGQSIENFIDIKSVNSEEVLLECLNLDLVYHYLRSDGLYNKLNRAGRMKRVVTDEEIAHAVFNAPENTRAKVRGEIMKLIGECKISGSMTAWDSFHLSRTGEGIFLRKEIKMDDPFDSVCQVWQDAKRSLDISEG